MKLRNKKTGEILEVKSILLFDSDTLYADEEIVTYGKYKSMQELTSDWEDYEPQEPLIKDEKIRKAVKAWARVNELTVVIVFYIDETETLKLDAGDNLIAISFESEEDYTLINGGIHTITELCGEEE